MMNSKFLSQCETEASVSPMIGLLAGKKNKKNKKKRKLLDISQIDQQLNNPIEIQSPQGGKTMKDKNKQKKNVVAANPQITGIIENGLSGKKKRKKSEEIMSSSYLNESDEKDVFEITAKKKSKKMKRKMNASLQDINKTFEEDTVDESPKKKKKKKKKHAEEDERSLDLEESFSSPTKKMDTNKWVQEFEKEKSTSKSPKKKKKDSQVESSSSFQISPKAKKKHKKSKFDESPEEKESLGVDTDLEQITKNAEESKGIGNFYSHWSKVEQCILIDKVLSSLNPDNTESYRVTIDNFDWSTINLDYTSPEDCKALVKKLIEHLEKYKTLSMLLTEAKEVSVKDRIRLQRVLSPKDRFIAEYCKKNKSREIPMSALRLEASSAWLKCPKSEKKAYEVDYEIAVNNYKLRKALDTLPELPKSPLAFYYESKSEKFGSIDNSLKARWRKEFEEMALKKKIPFVERSLKEYVDYIGKRCEYQKTHPDWNKPLSSLNPPRMLFLEYMKYIGMPRPKTSVMGLFMEDVKKKGALEGIDKKEILKTLSHMYQALPEKEKTAYSTKVKKLHSSFDEKYSAWEKSLDEDTKLFVKIFLKPKGIKESFSNVVYVSMTKPIFSGDPQKPPNGAFQIFMLKFQKKKGDKYKTHNELRKACSEAWATFSSELRTPYIKRNEENIKAYKEKLLQYVRNLGEEVKAYLGFRREELAKYFKEDIFESEYPNSDYPVYRKQTTDSQAKSKQAKVVTTLETSSDENDDDSVRGGMKQSLSDKVSTQKLSKRNSMKENNRSSENESDTNDVQAWQTPKHITVKSEVIDDDHDPDDPEEEEDDNDPDDPEDEEDDNDTDDPEEEADDGEEEEEEEEEESD